MGRAAKNYHYPIVKVKETIKTPIKKPVPSIPTGRKDLKKI